MLSFDVYLGAYWPVLSGTALFFLAGLLLWRTGEGAMERARKPLSWIRQYRQPGFPLRREVLAVGRFPVWWFCLTLVLALAAAFGGRLVSSMRNCGSWTAELTAPYAALTLAAAVIGAVAVFQTLWLLFDSPFVAILGTLLFACSPVRGHAAGCLLALALWLGLLYLRSEDAEWLYCLAIAAFCVALGAVPSLLWLAPLLLLAHWAKLRSRVRENRLTLGALALRLGLGLLVWGLALFAAAVWHGVLADGLQLRADSIPGTPEAWFDMLAEFLGTCWAALLVPPAVSMLLPPLVDAPLVGLGFWGCFSAGRLLLRRRNVRGAVALAVLAALVLVWTLASRWLGTLGLTLCFACLLKNCEIGRRRGYAAAAAVLGILFELLLTLAVLALPLEASLPLCML